MILRHDTKITRMRAQRCTGGQQCAESEKLEMLQLGRATADPSLDWQSQPCAQSVISSDCCKPLCQHAARMFCGQQQTRQSALR